MFTKLSLFPILIALFFSVSVFSSGKNISGLDGVVDLEQSISGSHDLVFTSGGMDFPMQQVIKASYCQVDVHTYAKGIGLVFSERYDMIKNFTFRMPGKYRGTFGVHVGAKSLLKGRWKIYYNEREKRDAMAEKLKSLGYLCKKSAVRKTYRKIQKTIKKDVKWVGNLFDGEVHTESKVSTDKDNKIASLDGRQSFIERYKSLENAKKSIYLQTMIFRGDELGRFFAEKLMEKRAEGLDVKVIVDGLGSGLMDIEFSKGDKKNTSKMLYNLMTAGIRVYGFSCDRSSDLIKNEVRGADIPKILRRHHEKMWMVDSENLTKDSVAIMGGINLASEYFALSGEHVRSWMDQDTAVKGPIIKDIRERFLSNWVENAVGFNAYKNDHKCLNPFNPVTQKEEYLKFKKENSLEYLTYKRAEDIEAIKVIKENIKRNLNGEKHLENVFLNKDTQFRNVDGLRIVHADPEAGENYTHEAYIKLINRAKKVIHLANAFFNPPKDLVEAMQNALKRGVKIKFYTIGFENNDMPLFPILGRSYFYPLYQAAVEGGNEDNLEIYEWDGTRGDSKEVSLGRTHTKYMIVDESFGLNGSHNLNHSSMANSEILLLFEGKDISKDMVEQFEFDLEFTTKITPERIKEFHKPKKATERIRNFFIKLLTGKMA